MMSCHPEQALSATKFLPPEPDKGSNWWLCCYVWMQDDASAPSLIVQDLLGYWHSIGNDADVGGEFGAWFLVVFLAQVSCNVHHSALLCPAHPFYTLQSYDHSAGSEGRDCRERHLQRATGTAALLEWSKRSALSSDVPWTRGFEPHRSRGKPLRVPLSAVTTFSWETSASSQLA